MSILNSFSKNWKLPENFSVKISLLLSSKSSNLILFIPLKILTIDFEFLSYNFLHISYISLSLLQGHLSLIIIYFNILQIEILTLLILSFEIFNKISLIISV